MEKIIQYFISVFIVLSIFNCSTKQQDPFDKIEKIKGVKDSIISFKNKYDEDFFIFSIDEENQHVAVTFQLPNKPFNLYKNTEYVYKKIKGVDLIYI